MEPFATVEDYEARYGDGAEDGRLKALLSDASAFIASQLGFSADGGGDVRKAMLTLVTCSIVNRKMLSGAYAGLSSVSQGAGGQTASISVYNPSGDFYLTAQERRSLGLSSGRVGTTDPWGGGSDA